MAEGIISLVEHCPGSIGWRLVIENRDCRAVPDWNESSKKQGVAHGGPAKRDEGIANRRAGFIALKIFIH